MTTFLFFTAAKKTCQLGNNGIKRFHVFLLFKTIIIFLQSLACKPCSIRQLPR